MAGGLLGRIGMIGSLVFPGVMISGGQQPSSFELYFRLEVIGTTYTGRKRDDHYGCNRVPFEYFILAGCRWLYVWEWRARRAVRLVLLCWRTFSENGDRDSTKNKS